MAGCFVVGSFKLTARKSVSMLPQRSMSMIERSHFGSFYLLDVNTYLLTNALHLYIVKHMKSITISSKNQIVIPSSVRLRLGVAGGDKLIVERISDTEVVLKKEPSYHDLIGTLATQKEDPVQRVRQLRDNWK
jgi:AbrB family looped-hinge helix DNA binding protein